MNFDGRIKLSGNLELSVKKIDFRREFHELQKKNLQSLKLPEKIDQMQWYFSNFSLFLIDHLLYGLHFYSTY